MSPETLWLLGWGAGSGPVEAGNRGGQKKVVTVTQKFVMRESGSGSGSWKWE